jgi:hypothetical protein
MESEFEIDLSDLDEDILGDEPQTVDQPPSKPVSKPKRKYTKSQKVLDNARKNLEKAREIKKQQSVHRDKFQKFEYEDSLSDSGGESDSEGEYSETDKFIAPTLPKAKPQKRLSTKKAITSKLSAREMKLMEKLERIEGMMSQFSKAKQLSGSGKKNVHKTVIVQPPPQYMPYRQRDPAVEKMKKSLLSDMF